MGDSSAKPANTNHLSVVIIVLLFGVFLLALLPYPIAGAGYFWDFSNALGLAGFIGLVILSLSSSKPLELKHHKYLSYIVVLFCLAHALLLVLGDGAVFTYLRAGAPWSMWGALVSFTALVGLIWHSQRPLREKLHAGYQGFAVWHRYLAIIVIALAAWHIIDSGYYFQESYQFVLVAMLCCLTLVRPLYASQALALTKNTVWLFVCCSILMVIIFSVLPNYFV